MRAIAWAVLGRRAGDRQTHWLTRVLETLRAQRRRIRARQILAQIDARTLRDAGIDPVAAHYEATQPFWIAGRRLRDR
ncbi:MAG: hypothetical protein OJJ21_09050 [Ferrovibrio sp.]|uniref:DUF1127 domain-containing protein n=1 Tax=Ferrovibrio sp. TaxID=1917215 RepID=UPI0026166FFB|nr:DUF1127 domain-containing protein [Ferrovibrio sp.]MCW0233731.1 hypothetical protein [Ferrovibrio sp.]